MFRATALLIVLAMTAMLTGCKTPEQMKADYPDWPAWGWWDNPAPTDDAPAPASASNASATASTNNGPASSSSMLADEPAMAAPPQRDAQGRSDAVPGAQAEPASSLARHRQQVWTTVAKLRDLDTYPAAERTALLDEAKSNLPAWYKPMSVDAPDTRSPEWVTVCIWDFMPEDEFTRTVAGCQAIARKHNLDFPYPATRRDVMAFVKRLADAPPPADNAPAASPDGDPGTVDIQIDE